MSDPNKSILETERLSLRPITMDDVDSLFLLFSDPIAMKYYPAVKTMQETRDWAQLVIQHHAKRGFSPYACITKKDTLFVGYCGHMFQKDVDGKDEVEIGYGLIRKYWHKGYATEAAMTCKHYGFREMKLARLVSLIRPENVPSVRVAERNGMQKENEIVRWNNRHFVYAISNEAGKEL